jgi:rod shape-determining protein MreC
MESFFNRYRNALVLIVVLVAQLLALAVQAKRPAADGADQRSVSLFRHVVIAVVTPPERLLHGTGMWFRSLWFGYVDLIHVRRENAGLQQEVDRLRLEQASIAQDAEQGRRLQKMLGFSEHYIYKTQPVQVIGTSGTDQSQVLYIDKGSDDGLAQDMPVITPDGIVGKLKDVFPHTSQVLLVSDPTSGVGVIIESTRTRGILKGRAFGQLQVVDISPDSRIKPGDRITTSGGDQIFPRGLRVGTVDRILADPEHDPLVDVIVHPAAALSQLEEVLVITSLSDVTSAQEAKDIAESEAESEAEQKKASDILSERLPSRVDPNAPADTNPEQVVDAAGNAVQTADHPHPIHPDQFSPNAEPDAAQMTPGRRWAPVKDGTEELSPHPKPLQTPATAATVAATSTDAGQTKTPAVGGAVAPQVAAQGAGSTANTPRHPASASPMPLKPQSGTRVIVDGPEPSHPGAAQTNASPDTNPVHPRKGPQLVPNDGSRPPQSEPTKKPDVPDTQQTSSPSPQGGAR